MTKISHTLTLVDLAGSPPLELMIGREFQGEGFFSSGDLCWVADLNDLIYLRRLLFTVLQRYRYQRPNTRVKPGYKSWAVGTEEKNFIMGVGIIACEDGDYPVFDFNRRVYLSLDQVQELCRTVDELIKVINAEKRHNAEIRGPGRQWPNFVDQWSAGIDRKYGEY
jgi:hypothetical protein